MSNATLPEPPASTGFSAEQKEYLAGLFAGVAARGQKFSDVEPAPPLDDLIFEERVKRELHPLDAYQDLLDNAARFATTKVSVELTHIETSGEVVLRVDDDGPGVPVEERTRIFERFARSDAGRGRGIGGAGLGLALVERVTRAHHGSVRCEASPLGGARFEVRLPGAP